MRLLYTLVLASLLLVTGTEAKAASPSLRHHHYRHLRTRHVTHRHHSRFARLRILARRHPRWWNPLFPPTHESQLAQNSEIDRYGLPRIKNNRELNELIRDGELVPIPVNEHLIVDKRLPKNRRYCRPWTAQFLTDLSDAFYAQFHEPIMVDSAVRTMDFQRRLRRWNGNAAPATGEVASSHLAGITVDIARRRMTEEEGIWVEQWLHPFYAQQQIEVEEEYRQRCFHIMVAKTYGTPFIETEPTEVLDVFLDTNSSL